ncbi:MAG TPA: cupin domain-containing protein [Desulfosporosinus sp.]|nr:cupin domain-containing protein [Desulfosporosinus sp.]
MLEDKIKEISKTLESVDDLVRAGTYIRVSEDTLIATDKVQLTTLFDMDECLVGLGVFKKAGDTLPKHKHEGVVQYLIQFIGKCSVSFDHGGYRILDVGECVKIPKGELHSVTSLSDQSQQIFICVPAEKGYRLDDVHEPAVIKKGGTDGGHK